MVMIVGDLDPKTHFISLVRGRGEDSPRAGPSVAFVACERPQGRTPVNPWGSEHRSWYMVFAVFNLCFRVHCLSTIDYYIKDRCYGILF